MAASNSVLLSARRDETFLFRVEKFSTDADNMLTIAVFDRDALSSDDFLGSVELSLTEEFRGRWTDNEIDKKFALKDPEQRVCSLTHSYTSNLVLCTCLVGFWSSTRLCALLC